MNNPILSRRQAIAGLTGIGALAAPAAALERLPARDEKGGASILPATVGLVEGQAARLSIVHHHHGKEEVPPTPCIIVADLVGPDGKSLASDKFADLKPNEARFVDFVHPGARGRQALSRLEIFGLVRYTPGHHIGASLEILDASSAMSTLSAIPIGVEDPELLPGKKGEAAIVPLLPPGTVGFLRGQFLRISLVHHVARVHEDVPPTPCNIVAEVFDAAGQLYASQKFSDCKHHQAVWFDVPHPRGKGPLRDTRFEVMVSVRHTPGHEIGMSVQVVDLSSGVTTLVPPVPCVTPDPAL